MNKLSITLPIGSQVCIESEDSELIREILRSFMPHLVQVNGELPQVSVSEAPEPVAHSNGHASANGNGHHALDPRPDPAVAETSPAKSNGSTAPVPIAVTPEPTANGTAVAEPAPAGAQPLLSAPMTPSDHEYIAFCQRESPLGDMRRVVVAAEAGHRYLGIESVDPDTLTHLFTLAGWPIPHSFVQTLRNAARTKFRWLERIPGVAGHYKVTNTGRSIVLGEGEGRPEAD